MKIRTLKIQPVTNLKMNNVEIRIETVKPNFTKLI